MGSQMSITDRLSWHVVGESVQGATHVKKHIPNRDTMFIWTPDNSGVGPPLVLAIADGRGSVRCCRSDLGAKFLVKIAARLLQNFADLAPDVTNQAALVDSTSKLGQAIVLNWQKAIEKHLAQNKLRPEEIARVGIAAGKSVQQQIAADPVLAYGATLLSILITESYALYLQFGEGDLLSVDRNGNPTAVFPTFELELTANPAQKVEQRTRTGAIDPYSQLTNSAIVNVSVHPIWRNLQIRLVPFTDYVPEMILVATDGYANSFKSDLDFRKIAPDYLHLIEKEGIGSLINQLDLILAETSRQGSGDDITLGLIKSFVDDDLDAEDLEDPKQAQLAQLDQDLADLNEQQQAGDRQMQAQAPSALNGSKQSLDDLSRQLNELADDEVEEP
jgi:hypothetical protein